MAKKVEVLEYVKNLLNLGVRPFLAEKKKCILARQGILGEKVITWSEKDGQPIVEKVDIVTLDETTGNPGYVVTKIDETGAIIIDAHGHDNTWYIADSTFQRKYTLNPEMGESIYKPTGAAQKFIEIPEDIIISQWGKDELIGKGGVINITDPSDMYGVSRRDFMDTYRILPEEPAKVRKITKE